MEATREVTQIVETAEAAETLAQATALRELASLELGLVGGGSAAVVFL